MWMDGWKLEGKGNSLNGENSPFERSKDCVNRLVNPTLTLHKHRSKSCTSDRYIIIELYQELSIHLKLKLMKTLYVLEVLLHYPARLEQHAGGI